MGNYESCVERKYHSVRGSGKKTGKGKLKEIEDMLVRLEQEYRVAQIAETLNKVVKLKYEYNVLMSKNVLKMLNQVKQKYFELGDKTQKLLARQLRQAQASRAIHSIRLSSSNLINDPTDINKCFAKFYEDVYQSQDNATANTAVNFLANLNLPKLNEDAVKHLDEDIILKEINRAIFSFPNNKSPGPDGFTIEFFKKFSDINSPLLLRMYKHSGDNFELPPTLYRANITLIPKARRDLLLVLSYRPISLIPIETKLIGKILANRLKSHICSIIHLDQTGFMPGRYMYFNLRHLFNILYAKHYTDTVIISLDAQRAFDQVEWKL